MKLQSCVVFSLAALLSCATTAGAGIISLEDLVNGDSIESGDKLFENFDYSSSGDMPGAAEVTVQPWTDPDGNFGIRFQGPFFDFQGGGSSDASISYTVTATDPNKMISDAHLSGNPDVLVPGGGAITITETFSQASNTMMIFDDGAGGERNRDWTFFDPPLRTVSVVKRILAEAADGSTVTMSFIDQTFSQTDIPEPAALGLLALGLGAVLMRRRIR